MANNPEKIQPDRQTIDWPEISELMTEWISEADQADQNKFELVEDSLWERGITLMDEASFFFEHDGDYDWAFTRLERFKTTPGQSVVEGRRLIINHFVRGAEEANIPDRLDIYDYHFCLEQQLIRCVETQLIKKESGDDMPWPYPHDSSRGPVIKRSKQGGPVTIESGTYYTRDVLRKSAFESRDDATLNQLLDHLRICSPGSYEKD